MMKKNQSSVRTPKRSTSLVATLNRPLIEQKHYERSLSPTTSFTSSILAKGMSDRLTPQKTPHHSRTNLNQDQIEDPLLRVNHRRAIDFTRRRTFAGLNEQLLNTSNNKENVPINRRQQQIYRFSPATSTNVSTKKYFFYPKPLTKKEDMLMNSYGLKILHQEPPQQRQNIYSNIIVPKIPENASKFSPPQQQQENNRRSSIRLLQPKHVSDSLDDLLCDREVESYFYPDKRQSSTSYSRPLYMNVETAPHYYSPPSSYIHGTLC